MKSLLIPKEVKKIVEKLGKAGFEAYVVGGCVRDFLIGKKPKDWDITTSATPKKTQKIFPDSVYENQFGTVGIKTKEKDLTLKIIEVTTFRIEGKYSDKRHPDDIRFAKSIKEDLSRRDFTINTLALKIKKNKGFEIIDPYKGQNDLNHKIIRCVGEPDKRFSEDALRLMRAIRFNVELGIINGWKIEDKTWKAVESNSRLIKVISQERIRDELVKILLSKEATNGMFLLHKSGLLRYIIPELEEGINVKQNKHHIYTVWEHGIRSLDYAANNEYDLEVRLASLFHDIAKPKVKAGEGKNCTFYGHEVLGAKMVSRILSRLKFSKDLIDKVVTLVRYHGFFYEVETTTDASIRRLLIKVGKDNIEALAQVREADRIGSGCPKAVPFKLRHFLFRVEKILKEQKGHQPSLKMLKVDGEDIMKIAKLEAGPRIGYILNILLEQILDDPNRNTKEILTHDILELSKLSDKELKNKNVQAKEKYNKLLSEYTDKIKKKYYV